MAILSQTPTFENPHSSFSVSEIWENYNGVVNRLNAVTGKNYDHHKIAPKSEMWNGGVSHIVNGTLFRQKVNGLINFLHAEYFPNERPPFSGEPQNIFETNQTVTQSTEIQVLMVTVLELQEKLIRAEKDFPEGTPENKFIKIFKDALKGTKSNMELIMLMLQTAQAVGLTVDKLASLFK